MPDAVMLARHQIVLRTGWIFKSESIIIGPAFVLVGMMPVVRRTLQNFTLEVAAPEDHAVYLSTLSLCMAGPMFLSPLAGYLIDRLGSEPVFLMIAGSVVASWLLTFRLPGPRRG